jgi:predicted component of type VI protein secretion system
MRNNRQLYWAQGLFLTPQHLQQQDLFHQGERQYLWRLAQPFGWGIRALKIREEGLAANTIEILRCEIVTRDGLVMQAGPEATQPNAQLRPRSFEGLIDPAIGPLSVYLGVPHYQAGQPNLWSGEDTASQGTVSARYRLTREARPDLFDLDAPEADVGFIEYNLALLFDRESTFPNASQAFNLIKVAELLPLATGIGARLSNQYIPPCVTIDQRFQCPVRALKGDP